MAIDENDLKSILKEEMYIKAKTKALNILSKADQSENKIREKLSNDFEEDTIDLVIEFLQKNNFINDEILAQKIVNTNVNLNKYGKNKIRQNLLKSTCFCDTKIRLPLIDFFIKKRGYF